MGFFCSRICIPSHGPEVSSCFTLFSFLFGAHMGTEVGGRSFGSLNLLLFWLMLHGAPSSMHGG